MIGRRYLGIDIRGSEMRAVALRRQGKRPVLVGGRTIGVAAGTIVPSAREPQVRERNRLVPALKELLDPLAGGEERLALTIPDTSGRLILTDIETPPRTRQEALQILRWQLKGTLPLAPDDIQLDYQLLEQREDGRTRVAVVAVTRAIVEQYEDLLAVAGYHAVTVGFHSLHVANYYRHRFERPEDSVLVIIEGGAFALHYYQGQQLVFHRAREIDAAATAVYHELSRSLVGAMEQYPALRRAGVFVQCDWADHEGALGAVQSAFARSATLLEPHLHAFGAATGNMPAWRLRGLIGAVGAAEGLL